MQSIGVPLVIKAEKDGPGGPVYLPGNSLLAAMACGLCKIHIFLFSLNMGSSPHFFFFFKSQICP